ncbi:hypothetical protein E1301_Tti014240 [Triplophysa tibetana]|uniref:Uncharacterized protein n=1 Tax=Triplophysa tibetana TaxID=1572043 RepID=A0A5A9N3G5_9TELE|nr:hypothetical protein E1301_Tti014240 [Triplophysa tibetana]
MELNADANSRMKDLPSDEQCSCSPSVTHLDERIADRQQQIELSTLILDDLLQIQRIIQERGLENVTFEGPDN